MAKYQDNDWFLSIDGTDVSAYLLNVSLDSSMDTVEITAGSGTDNVQRGEGLEDHSLSFDIYHDTAAAYALTLIAVGAHDFIYGPEDNVSGKPKHAQSMIIETVPHEVSVDKSLVSFSVSAVGAAAPSTDMFAGGVWA